MLKDGYFLGERYLGGMHIEITFEEFSTISESCESVWSIAEAENLFSLLPRAYVEFETELFTNSLNYRVLAKGYEEINTIFDNVSQILNLKTLNILNAAKAYQDQILKTGSLLSNKLPELQGELKRKFSECFDQSFEYRLMEGLRNYAQHKSLPLHGNSFSNSNLWKDGNIADGNPFRQRLTLNPFFSGEALSSDKSVKSKTRDEIQAKNIKGKRMLFGFPSKQSNRPHA